MRDWLRAGTVGEAMGVKALLFERREARYLAANISSRFSPGAGASTGPLRLADVDVPELPAEGWQVLRPRLTGICGSDLATVAGKSSRYFEPLVSFPFTPGHEVVADLEDGSRVALEPVLGPEARGEAPPFAGAAAGDAHDYGYLACDHHLDEGIQVGYCASTGGGWGTHLVAHQSQLHPVDNSMSDEAAVMVEPTATGVHAALRGRIATGDTVAILGAGTMGLCALAAVDAFTEAGTAIIGAKYPVQKDLAAELGATSVVAPNEMKRAVRRAVGCRMVGDDLAGGADVTIDAVGSAESLAEAISLTRPRGRVVLLGMPGVAKVDLTGLWHREIELAGSYTYGTEQLDDGSTRSSFDMAFDLVRSARLERLVSAKYPLARYREAITHAAEAGHRGAVKVVFDLRDEKGR